MNQTEPNAAQRAGWDGPEGDTWTEHEDFYNNGARLLTPRLLSAAAVHEGERVLDVGCGTGETTRLAARAAGSGEVLGVDLSSRMLERARQRAAEEEIANVRFEQADAQTHAFPDGVFDVAISRFGIMFFDDPVAAFANIRRALAPGGRVAMLAWRDFDSNEWVRTLIEIFAAGRNLPKPPPGVPSPFALADPERTTAILTEAGFANVVLEPLDEPMYYGPDPNAAHTAVMNLSIVRGLLTDLDQDRRNEVALRAKAELEARQREDGVWMDAASWLIRADR